MIFWSEIKLLWLAPDKDFFVLVLALPHRRVLRNNVRHAHHKLHKSFLERSQFLFLLLELFLKFCASFAILCFLLFRAERFGRGHQFPAFGINFQKLIDHLWVQVLFYGNFLERFRVFTDKFNIEHKAMIA